MEIFGMAIFLFIFIALYGYILFLAVKKGNIDEEKGNIDDEHQGVDYDSYRKRYPYWWMD